MKHKSLYVALGVLALAVAVPLATGALAQSPSPTATPTPQAPANVPQFHGMGPGMMGTGGPQGMMGGAGMMGGGGALADFQTLKRVATLLNTTPQDLYTQLQASKTIAALAQEKGVTVEAVAATILAPFKDEIQIKVKYGNISQEQADFQVFVRTQELVKRLSQTAPQNILGTTGRLGPGGMMAPNATGTQGTAPNGMMGGSGMMGGAGGGMMGGGSGLTW